MKTATTLFATTVVVASLAAAGAVFAHPGGGMGGWGPGWGPGAHMGMGPGWGPGGHMGGGPGWGPGGHMGGGPGMGPWGGMAGPESAAAGLADMKSALKITPQQEAAWTQYAAVVTRHVEAREGFHKQMYAQMTGPDAATVDHAALHETMIKFQQESLAERDASLKDLYATFTPEQKALADARLQGRRGGRMGPYGRTW